MRAATLILLATFASPVLAQEGMYVGLGLGRFDYSEDAASLAPAPLRDTLSSWKVYGGFEIGEHIAIEIRYGAAGEIEQSVSGTDPDLGNATLRFDTDFKITTALAVGVWPRDWGVLLGGLGYFDSTTEANLTLSTECCGNFNDKVSFGDNGLAAMLGVEWRFGRFGTGLGIRLEYEWLDVDNADASTIGVGIAYRF
jgi:hypothetical protein